MRCETFVNRVRELAFLEKRFASGQAEMVVLYGRRRRERCYMMSRAFSCRWNCANLVSTLPS